MNDKLGTRDFAAVALFAAVMAICSWISIPAAVPFTMQTFGVFLTVGLLGGKRGSLAVAVFLLLGAIGAPVFAGFAGGLGYMLGATGGYIIGFLFSALLMWVIEKMFGKSMWVLTASMAAGLIVCYAFGTAWFMTVYTKNTGEIGLATALGWCVIPYIIPDVIKITLASVLSKKLRPVISGLMA
ncbi:MAG: biotin transporter BioY [Mogibacterium sp.]|nr:biotin transporter BioY [Mogibacterium sp.]